LHSPNLHQESIAVLGAGIWGSTLAWLLSSAGKSVCLWSRDRGLVEKLKRDHKIEKPFSLQLGSSVSFSNDLAECLQSSDIVLICCTSQSMRAVCHQIKPHLPAQTEERKTILVSAVKGLELTSLKRMSEVIIEVIPNISVCALSGPNLAAEIMQGLPAAAVIASHDITTAARVQKILSVSKFRVYSNTDIVGVELGGTLKNVIGIAAGGSDGLNLGVNAKSALITRGLAEMTRLAVYMGAKPATMAGLAGMGDLIATCMGPLSRNYRFGQELARGKKVEQIRQEMEGVIEGIPTTEAVCELSKRLGVELPIAELVQNFISGAVTPEKAIITLMARPLASE
jgi:glycerol-3-phosphate dehydrogenase (NAD(P)+)